MLSNLFGMADATTFAHAPQPSLDPGAQLMAIRARLDALELACAGLWALLKEKAGYTDEEIASFIREVDARDRSASGSALPSECPACGRQLLSHGYRKCLWCGTEIVDCAVNAPPLLSNYAGVL